MSRFDLDDFVEKLLAVGFPLISTALVFWAIHDVNKGSTPVVHVTGFTIPLILVYMVATMVLNLLMFKLGIFPLLLLIVLNLLALLLWRDNPILRTWVLANLSPAAYYFFYPGSRT